MPISSWEMLAGYALATFAVSLISPEAAGLMLALLALVAVGTHPAVLEKIGAGQGL